MAVARKPGKASTVAKAQTTPSAKEMAEELNALPGPTPAEIEMASVAEAPVQLLELAANQVADVRELGRSFVLGGADNMRLSYDRLRSAAEEATGNLEQAFNIASGGAREFQIKAIEAMESNAMAFFAAAKTIVSAKDATQAMTLATDAWRKQFEAAAQAGGEMSTLAQRIAQDSFAPLTKSLTPGADAGR